MGRHVIDELERSLRATAEELRAASMSLTEAASLAHSAAQQLEEAVRERLNDEQETPPCP